MSAPALSDVDGTYACSNQDLHRSTAVLLSARFAYVTPSGRLTRCKNRDEQIKNRDEHIYVIDGGYVDSSASMTVHDLYRQVERLVECHNLQVGKDSQPPRGCPKMSVGRAIRPVLVQVDNGYSTVATAPAGPRPKELLVPPRGRRTATATVEPAARQRAHAVFAADVGAVFAADVGPVNYVRVANVRHPGIQAPLGWVLSTGAREDLKDQLDRESARARGLIF
jgi:hypothetical protein